MKHKLLFSFLFPGLFKLSMAQESPVIVVSGAETETPAEVVVEEKTVTEQAVEIVETAEQLAQKIAAPDAAFAEMHDMIAEMRNAYGGLHAEIQELRTENNSGHDTIISRLDEILNFEEEENEEPPEAVIVATPTAEPITEVVETQKPEKRSRRWL